MNKNQAKNFLDVIRAFNDGKQIQVKVGDKWKDVTEWHFCEELRIKPDERFVYKHDDKFVIMDVKIPLIKESPLFEGSLEECNKWIDEQVKEPACTRDEVLTAEEVEGNYTIEQNCGENRVEGGVLSVSGSVSEKHYKPFEDTAELMVHYSKHFNIDFPPFCEPIIWVKNKSNDTRYLIIGFEESRVLIGNSWFTMKDLFRQCVFLDNSHCGTLEE